MKIDDLIRENQLYSKSALINFIKSNCNKYSFYEMSRIIEYSNTKRKKNSAYYTDDYILEEIFEKLPNFINETDIKVLEPSVGAGNFIPYILNKYHDKNIIIDVVDIDSDILDILKTFFKCQPLPDNVKINFINANFITHEFNKSYDLIIGNPPFSKIKKYEIEYTFDPTSRNLSSYFLEKAITLSDYVALIMPKNLLNTPEYNSTRSKVRKINVEKILDFGEKGFKGVLVETICLFLNLKSVSNHIEVFSIPRNVHLIQKQSYVFDDKLPYWIIYRNKYFDGFYRNMKFDIFKVFRDRQITNKILKNSGEIRVLKSRNISNDGKQIIDINGYDAYTEHELVKELAVYKFLDKRVLVTPNMTYNSRIFLKPKGYLINGSLAVLELKNNEKFTAQDRLFISTRKYREFLKIARNFQTRSLNIDNNSVYFFGKRKDSK